MTNLEAKRWIDRLVAAHQEGRSGSWHPGSYGVSYR